MAATTIDEIVTQINNLPKTNREELIRRLKEEPRRRTGPNGSEEMGQKQDNRKNDADPNLIWIKENKHKYACNYIALKNGELIAFGKTIKEADQAAKAKGVNDPLLHYILAEGEEAWGGSRTFGAS